MFKYEFSEVLTLNHGLCTNASLAKIRSDVKRDMFKTFSKFSGNYTYPLFIYENYVEYCEMDIFTNTPERLELAKHCLKYLKNI